ncbi:glycoside hydrolase/deacetylase, partial [Aureobasidium melanogenum]
MLAPDNTAHSYLIFGGGFIANQIKDVLTTQGKSTVMSKARIESREDVLSELVRHKPTRVINCAGVRGLHNADWCEDHKVETMRSNVLGALNVVDVCFQLGVHITHIGSACIYTVEGDETAGDRSPFTEADEPFFQGCWYGRSRLLSELSIRHYPNLLLLRVRIPISADLHPKNHITKLLKYEKIVDLTGSGTVLPNLIPAAIILLDHGETGTYNWVTPGEISNVEIMELAKKAIRPDLKWQTFKTIDMHLSSLLTAVLAMSGMVTASAIPSPLLESRQSSPAAGVVYNKCSKPGVFALAFDDGPGQYTEELIKTLNAAGAKATFFFTGTLYGCIYNRAAAVKAAYSSGHQVASHTWTHPQTLDTMSIAQLTTEMQRLETALVNIIGVKPTYMRPPYLKTGGNVPTAMRNLGYRIITDSIDSQDWNGVSVSASEQKFRSAGPSTLDGKGHISLLHETYASTVRDLVPRLIKWAKENNLKMVTVAECLGDANGAYAKGTGGGAQQC